ncbi:MAG: 30S ribosomal protein S12 methylthiotransferase RimO [Bacteroidia bacterium]|nr:30S ribosomal protein S12 methylthiotransferase RimO [Bacteroidia bacterium]
MKTKSHKPNKVAIVTLGCSKNTVDSEVIQSQLENGKVHTVHEDTKGADTVIINTCGFIDNAKQESIDTILDFAQEKKAGNLDNLIVTGCLSERYKADLSPEIPEVDKWYGTFELPQLLNNLGVDYRKELIGERKSSVAKHYAYMKISEGCDRPCSFCAIPLMRGKHVSKSMDQLVGEAKALVKDGIKEIMLIAQDSTYYGIDLYGERKLAELMDRLSDVVGLDWIRLHYAYPSKFPFDVLPIMNSKPNICKYLDIPIQHISDNVLKSMRRGITKRRTEEVLDRIQSEVENIALRTTLLVGHPGEYDQDFEELKDFVSRYKFNRLGVFTYSHEDGTHAGTLEDHVSEQIKSTRADEIMAIQHDISWAHNQKLIGTNQKVIIDRIEGDSYIGRTQFDSPEVDNEVIISLNEGYLRVGDFANTHITGAESFDLIAKLIK